MRTIQKTIAIGFWLLASHVWPQSGPPLNAGNLTDPRIILSNPAALAIYPMPAFVSGYNRYYVGLAGDQLSNGTLGFGLPLGAVGCVGLNGHYFTANIFSRQRLAADFAKPLLGNKLTLGARVSYIRLAYDKSQFHRFDGNDPLFRDGNAADAFGFSIGMLVTPVEQVSVGFVVDHLNRPNLSLTGDEKGKVPIGAQLGAMVSLPFARPLFSVEYEANELYFNAGMEKPLLSERAILRGVAAKEQLGFGAAYWFGSFRLDYDLQWPLSDLNQESSGSHYITVSYAKGISDFSIEILPVGKMLGMMRPYTLPCDTLFFDLTVRPIRGHKEPVQLSLAGVPPGVSAEMAPASIMPKQTASLKVIIHSDAMEGSFRFAARGKSKRLARSARVFVDIKHRPPLAVTVKSTIDTVTVTETHHVREETPLLNYIFFAKDSVEIPPDRYILQPELKIRDDDSSSVIEQYRNVLNIFARRLKDNPDLKIELIGCNADYGNEKGNLVLSRERAQSVRHHLVEVCGVNSAQITIQPHNLPDNPSTCNDPLCREENRRVEILPQRGSEILLAPLKTTATEATPSDAICTFVFSAMNSDAGAKNWEFTISDDSGKMVRTTGGVGAPPNTWLWDWRNNSGAPVSFGHAFKYRLKIQGECGRQDSIQWQSIFVKHHEQERISETERIRLFLFQFDSDSIEVNALHLRQRLDRIVERFHANPGATILVTGHADTIGGKEYNQQLSIKRAKTIYQALIKRGIPPEAMRYEGFGWEKPMASNALPEGRMMNRRVEVEVIYPNAGEPQPKKK
jgi:outer membrane protein OmpA-like peptidoglycan-associated protein